MDRFIVGWSNATLEDFFKSLLPIWKRSKKIRKYWLEIVLIILALIASIFSATIYSKGVLEMSENVTKPSGKIEKAAKEMGKIYVDVSGSVNKPDLYEASNELTLKEALN